MADILLIGSTLVVIGLAVAGFSWYRVVPSSEAHLVVTPKKRMVCSPDEKIQRNGGKNYYFSIPSIIPFLGRRVRVMSLTIRQVNGEQETFDKDQARYVVSFSLKFRIEDVLKASETFINDDELQRQLISEVESAVRAVTVKYDVNVARANKQLMSQEIETVLKDTFAQWGLVLTSFAMVDFNDTSESTIISDISRRREVEISSITRQQNAEKLKEARFKEAESDELAKKREIERDQVVSVREQEKAKLIAEKQKEAQESAFKVIQVQTIKQAEIDKEKALVFAGQQREVAEISKVQKRLEGEGDRLRLEEVAKGNAAATREQGYAEADAKEKLQQALNKFEDKAIRALVAEKIVEKERAIGIAGAEALSNSDFKVFVGDQTSKQGFDLGALISATQITNTSAADSYLNRLGRPNDLGLLNLAKADPESTLQNAKKKTDQK